jgi:hypothetical protein
LLCNFPLYFGLGAPKLAVSYATQYDKFRLKAVALSDAYLRVAPLAWLSPANDLISLRSGGYEGDRRSKPLLQKSDIALGVIGKLAFA